MTELAAHLVERVLPGDPVRQWVLSLPWSLRYLLAFDAALCRDVLAVFICVVFGWLRRSAARHGPCSSAYSPSTSCTVPAAGVAGGSWPCPRGPRPFARCSSGWGWASRLPTLARRGSPPAPLST